MPSCNSVAVSTRHCADTLAGGTLCSVEAEGFCDLTVFFKPRTSSYSRTGLGANGIELWITEKCNQMEQLLKAVRFKDQTRNPAHRGDSETAGS